MNEQKPYAEVLVVFLLSEEGGRKNMPFLYDQCYRPHFRVKPSLEMLGVEFVDGPDGLVQAGVPTFATVRFSYYPDICYDELKVGTKFEILEGAHVVGHGEVTRR
jgi:translation elongation factor EF-Tu-like GTPase